MAVVRTMLKYTAYYIVISVVVSMFAGHDVQQHLLVLCKAALAISMFAAVFQLLLQGEAGAVAQNVSSWCLRGTTAIAIIVVVSGIGVQSISSLFL